MTPKTNYKEANRRLIEKHKNKIIMFNYIKMNYQASFICNVCKYKWQTNASSVINGGKGCPECSKIRGGQKRSLSYLNVYNCIQKEGCELLSSKYKNNLQKLEIKYPCGHINNISFANFTRRKISCRKCFKEKYYKFRYGLDDIVEILEFNGLTFLGFDGEYEHGNSKLIYQCSLGHITKRDVKYVIKFPTCKKCSYHNPTTHNWNGGFEKLAHLIRSRMEKWSKECLEFYNYTCVISGKTDNIDVHHLYGFNMIVQEAVYNCRFSEKKSIEEYTEWEIDSVAEETQKLHEKYSGICLTKAIHILFHNYYGRGNNTTDQFYEFQSRISSGEIQLPN